MGFRMILRIQILVDPTVCLLQWSAFGIGAPGAHLQVSLVQPNRSPINMAQNYHANNAHNRAQPKKVLFHMHALYQS